MPTLQDQICEIYLAKLTESGAVDLNKVEQLRVLMANGKKLKTDDVIKLFSSVAVDGIA